MTQICWHTDPLKMTDKYSNNNNSYSELNQQINNSKFWIYSQLIVWNTRYMFNFYAFNVCFYLFTRVNFGIISHCSKKEAILLCFTISKEVFIQFTNAFYESWLIYLKYVFHCLIHGSQFDHQSMIRPIKLKRLAVAMWFN